ncbi:hypothetical protein ACFOLC_08375 [Lysobacter cavernae]|uniref:EF-hand domain-containing protein n=1 Tax=Lysobacter cavernae TaxID=1685901 RepID=A0ABV7RQD1_9GAMM
MSPKPRSRFTLRRKFLLGFVVLLLGAIAWLHFTGAAGTSGIASQDMDWDGDGAVTRHEVLQSLYAVVVEKTTQGQRECRAYTWRRDGGTIRVDCRTTPASAADTKKDAGK